MRFRIPTLRLELVVVLLFVVLIAMLLAAQNNEWMGQVMRSTANTMTVSRPMTVAQALAQRSTVIYTPSAETIPNPERGFYRYIETRSSAPTPYAEATLAAYAADGVRLLYCIHYLDSFVGSDISATFLEHMQQNLDRVRAAGLKCILRFAYTDSDPTERNEEPPFGDANKARILAHIAQLTPILRAHADVIAFVQAGFIGVWGEWYYTDHFVDDPSVPWEVSAAQHGQRFEVLNALLDALPITRTVSVRYPFARQAMFQDTAPLSGEAAHSGTPAARTGFHNDCFLADETDSGTFRADQLESDKAYLAASTRYLPLGGESCAANPPRSSCATALDELARFHWSYLNREFNEDVLAGWQAEGCLAEIQNRLGYRLVLKRGSFPTNVTPGGSLRISLELENQGFAAPVNPRPIELILRQTPHGETRILGLNTDLRQWLPGALHRIEDDLIVPADLPPGDYDLLLRLPDPSPALAAQPVYAIRFANENTWDAASGANRLLHTLHVDPAIPDDEKVHIPWVKN